MKKFKQSMLAFAAMMSIAVPSVGALEGNKMRAYLDGGGVPTICRGETEGVKLGDETTSDACDFLFTWRLGAMAWAVDGMVDPEMTPEVWAALSSWAYNVGINAAQKSSVIRLMNEGKTAAACNALVYKNASGQWAGWVYDNGKVVKGLVNRRLSEKKLCMSGLPKIG